MWSCCFARPNATQRPSYAYFSCTATEASDAEDEQACYGKCGAVCNEKHICGAADVRLLRDAEHRSSRRKSDTARCPGGGRYDRVGPADLTSRYQPCNCSLPRGLNNRVNCGQCEQNGNK